MTFNKLKKIYFSIFGAGFLGCVTSLIIGLIRCETRWGIGGILFLCFLFGFILAPTILFIVIRILILKVEDNLIIKDFGTPESHTKTYFIYINRTISVPSVYPKLKNVTNFKFSPSGLYCNTKKLLFLWNNVDKVIVTNIIAIFATASNGTKIQLGLPKQKNFLYLVQTFVPEKVEQ